MGIFKTTRLFFDVSRHSDIVANELIASMRNEGYDVIGIKLSSGDWDISIKKGNTFKAILGLQTALKVTISPAAPHVYVKAGVGIFGQQAIPTILTLCVWWPFAITQIWGIIQQSRLDKLVMDIVQNEFNRISPHPVVSRTVE